MSGIDLCSCRTGINWKLITASAMEMLAQAALLNFRGMISPLFKALGSSLKDDSIPCRAKKLIIESSVLAIIETITNGVFEREPTPAQIQDCLNYILSRSETAIERHARSFDQNDFRNPQEGPFFREFLLPSFKKTMAFVHPENEIDLTNSLNRNFKAQFHKLYLSRFEYYSGIEEYLYSHIESANRERDVWRDYSILLVQRFEGGILLGEEGEGRVRLSDVYQPLRSFWMQYDLTEDTAEGIQSRTPSRYYVNMLDSEVESWLSKYDDKDTIRLISGGPGSGKSTFARKLASDYATVEDWKVLFIPLQRLRETGPLEDRIDEYFRRQMDEPFGDISPFKEMRARTIRNWLVIFDGLDELAGEGTAASNASQEFATALSDWRTRIAGSLDVRFIVLGRAPSMQDAQKRLDLLGRGTLHVQDMLPKHLELNKFEDPKGLRSLDQRASFWQRYAIAKSLPLEIPPALSAGSLQDLSKEPLLAYLLIYSGYVEKDWELAAQNKNRIYSAIFVKIWDRERAKETRKYLNDLGKPCFDALLQALGLAAWHGSGRTGDEETFEKVKKNFLRPTYLKLSQKSEVGDLESIAVLFYTRRDEEGRRGFEFLHKSFGEYLSGVALANAFFRWANQLVADEAEISPEVFLSLWAKIACYQEVDDEVFGFLRREIELLFGNLGESSSKSKIIIESLIEPVDIAIRKGFYLDHLKADTSFEQQLIQQNNALLNLLACVNACARVAFEVQYFRSGEYNEWEEGPIVIPALTEGKFLRQLLTRFNSNLDTQLDYVKGDPVHWPHSQGVISQVLSYYDLSNNDLDWMQLVGFRFSFCLFSRCSFVGTRMDSLAFQYCDLKYSNFELVSLDIVEFYRCDLTEASFRKADFYRCTCIRSNLSDVDFRKTRMRKAVMDLTSLENAEISRKQSLATRRYQFKYDYLKSRYHSERLQGR